MVLYFFLPFIFQNHPMPMKLASIDIGSNAIRLLIVNVFEEEESVSFKKLEFLRFPLRLGRDVFTHKKISKPTLEKYTLLMQTFKNLIDLYEVKTYRAVATSAMREAKNGKEVVNHILKQTGIKIEIISGNSEAEILQTAIIPYLENEFYLHIDVGGGSTELNIFEGNSFSAGKSFKIGSVRKLKPKDRKDTFSKMEDWLQASILHKVKNITSIGTGGNINKLYKIANKGKNIYLPVAELKALKAYVNAFSLKERKSFLKMNPDRADVIIPASSIYIKMMDIVKSDRIMVPQVGLKDGLIHQLYQDMTGKKDDVIDFIDL